MSKTLQTIQTISKVLKVISLIIFIFCIIGAVICLLGFLLLLAIKDIEVGNMTIKGMLAEEGASISDGIFAMIVATLSCIGGAITAKFAEIYFKNELNAKTPFTYEGAKELQRLGIISIAIPAGTSLLSSIAFAVYRMFDNSLASSTGYSISIDIGIGIALIIMSVIFKYGAEREEQLNTQNSKEYEDFNKFNGFDQ